MNSPAAAFGFAGPELPDYTFTAEFLYTPAPSEIAVTIKQFSRADNTDSLFAYGDFDNIVAVDEGGVLFYTSTQVRIRNLESQYVGLSLDASLVSINDRVISVDPRSTSRASSSAWRSGLVAQIGWSSSTQIRCHKR